MLRKLLCNFSTICLLLFPLIPVKLTAQNINGEKIQVAADALTVLKFNSEIKRFELGDRGSYTCQVRDNDNSIVIKTIGENPASTNLVVIEGKRSHYFIIEYLKKIDINNTKLFYDYSDLKELKKKAQNAEDQQATPAASGTKEATVAAKETKQERKAREKEEKRVAIEAEQQAKNEEKARQLAKDQELAAAREKERLREAEENRLNQLEKDKQLAQTKAREAEQQRAKETAEKLAQASRDKEIAQAKANEIKRLEAEEKARQQEKDREIAQAKAEEKQRMMNDEQAEKLRKQKQIAEAKEQEKARLAEEAKARKLAKDKEQAELMEKERLRLTEEQKAKQLEKEIADAKEKERKRVLDEENAKKLAAEKLIQEEKNKVMAAEKERVARLKKYPGINFLEPPNGQKLTGEYFRPVDTAENYYVSSEILKQDPRVTQVSDTVNGISTELQGITFSGVNAYMRLRISNNSKKEIAVGRMNLQWFKKDGTNYNLFACYVTGFPVLAAGAEATIIYVTRAVNAQDTDTFNFSLTDRLEKLKLEFPIRGELYNQEMSRQQR